MQTLRQQGRVPFSLPEGGNQMRLTLLSQSRGERQEKCPMSSSLAMKRMRMDSTGQPLARLMLRSTEEISRFQKAQRASAAMSPRQSSCFDAPRIIFNKQSTLLTPKEYITNLQAKWINRMNHSCYELTKRIPRQASAVNTSSAMKQRCSWVHCLFCCCWASASSFREGTSSLSWASACWATLAMYSYEVSGSVIVGNKLIQQGGWVRLQRVIIMEGLVEEAAESQRGKYSEREGEVKYTQSRYRWVVVVLMGCSLMVSGLANNAIIPLEHKMTLIYGVSDTKVSLSVILCFLAFSLANFPANYIIDTRGLRTSFLIGTALYSLGALAYSLINLSYNWMILGTMFLGMGQPFLLNCPAKVAAFWFFPQHRASATALLVAINLLGLGVGFLVPALCVSQDSVGKQAEGEIGRLYLGYFIAAAICFVLNCIFMRTKPVNPPSAGATADKVSSPRQILRVLKSDRNLWKFYGAYFLVYGTFVAFASNVNFIIKPYGYSDLQIAIDAILLLIIGSTGAIACSLFIKRTGDYKTAVRTISMGSAIALIVLCLWLNSFNFKLITAMLISVLGFILTPVIPTSYQLGCELAFPLGQAQITGLLNGGAFLWTFLAGTLVTTVFGFGQQVNSLLIMMVLSIFVGLGCYLYFNISMDLKRTEYEKQKGEEKEVELGSPQKMSKQQKQTETESQRRYSQLIEEKITSAPVL